MDGGDGSGSSTSAVRLSGGGAAAVAGIIDPALRLTLKEIAGVRSEAVRTVRVPQHVIQLVADLRTYLQEKIEPPVYVSDRRLVKAVALMQVWCGSSGGGGWGCWGVRGVGVGVLGLGLGCSGGVGVWWSCVC